MAADFSRCMASDIIELTAKGQARILVHKDILTSQSQPFRNAITGVWKESAERKINLEDWDKETVGRLVEFLYTSNYSYPDPEPILPEPQVSAALDRGAGQQGTKTPGTRIPGTIQSQGSGGDSPSDRHCPLTPLDQCLPRCLLENRKTDAERLELFLPDQHGYKEALLSHAAVYALARYKAVDSLQILALKRLTMTLCRISQILPGSRLPLGVVDLVKYVYSHTDALRSSEEPLRRLISQFAALNFPALQTGAEFVELMSEGGDFVNDLMAKVSRRLVAAETGLGISVTGGPGPLRFVSRIRVLYSIQPDDCVQELNGGSSDINHRQPSSMQASNNLRPSLYNSSSVYLVPEYTVHATDACTEFYITIQCARDASRFDLTKNENAEMFRYLVPVKDPKVKEKVTEVALVGSTSRVKNVALVGSGEFDGMTTDINTHRNDGYYLYLAWKSVGTE